MEWNRSNAIGLALASCTLCDGHGMVDLIRGGAERPCDCVFRAIFRACYRRFRECALPGAQVSTVSIEHAHGPGGKRFYSRKREEFAADFCLITRRVLNDLEYKLFRYTFLLGADWRMAAPRLGLDRGTFFHLLYRVEEKLGREFADTKPYALYPIDEYFGGVVQVREFNISHRPIRLRGEIDRREPMTPRRDVASDQRRLNRAPVPLTA